MLANLTTAHPGCLVATFCYAERTYDADVRALNREAVMGWRKRFTAMIEEIAARYPLRDDIAPAALADMLCGIVEGGIVLSKALDEPKLLADQIMMFRSYVRLLFLPEVAMSVPVYPVSQRAAS